MLIGLNQVRLNLVTRANRITNQIKEGNSKKILKYYANIMIIVKIKKFTKVNKPQFLIFYYITYYYL